MLRLATVRFYSSSAHKPVIGFIGLGQMGYPMASNLARTSVAAGGLVVFDVVKSATDAFANEHASLTTTQITVVDSVQAVAQRADVIITMLPTPSHVKHVYQHDFLGHVRPNTLLIDSSTIDPNTSKFVSHLLSSQSKALVVDAPVSGGIGGARNATLTFMVGGESQAFDRAEYFLKPMGKRIVHCGPSGTGQVAKICNNMLLGCSMVALSESLVLGERLGLDPRVLVSIINTSSGRSWASDTYNPLPGFMDDVPASRDYKGGFAVGLMQKDLGLALAAAESVKTPVPMTATADNVYKTAMNIETLKKLDMGVIYQWLLGGWRKFVK